MAIRALVDRTGGPPGIAVVVQRGSAPPSLHAAGRRLLPAGGAPRIDDQMRLASVAKAFSGAAALALASLLVAPAPATLLSYVASEPLGFPPGTRYRYSNSDNIAVGLIVERATGHSYEQALADLVFTPLGLAATTLPRGIELSEPSLHGYVVDPPNDPEDVSELFAAGWTWASGGIVSTPVDDNTFVRAYASGALTDAATHAAQFRFRAGSSEPPGPGKNSVGLAIFRYRTACGTVYGHTGNTAGYTQFTASPADGTRSATVSVSSQITPGAAPRLFPALRKVFGLAVCAALARQSSVTRAVTRAVDLLSNREKITDAELRELSALRRLPHVSEAEARKLLGPLADSIPTPKDLERIVDVPDERPSTTTTTAPPATAPPTS